MRRSRYGKRRPNPSKSLSKKRSKSVTFRLKKVEKKVRVLTPEKKFKFTAGAFGTFVQSVGANPIAALSNGWFSLAQGIGGINQGAQSYERVGTDLVKGSYYVKLDFTITPPAFSAANPFPSLRQMRIVAITTALNDQQFVDGNWLIPYVDPLWNRTRSPISRERLLASKAQILYDKLVTWQRPDIENPINAAADRFHSQSVTKLTIRLKPIHKMRYDNNGGASLLTPLYILCFDDIDNAFARPLMTLSSYQEYWQDNC